MINKSKKYGRYFLIVTICAIIGIRTIRHLNQDTKSESLSHLISDLERYKSQKGKYPADLQTSGIIYENWVYYTTDSTQDNFSLAYSEGIMDVNTIFYDSKTRKWEKRFNY